MTIYKKKPIAIMPKTNLDSLYSQDAAINDSNVIKTIERGIIEINKGRVTYNLNQKKSYSWSDPEEWIRCRTIAFLIIEKNYPSSRMQTEVSVPRRTPNDWADIVVYQDDACRIPYLVVENKSHGQTEKSRSQGIEQVFGNANSLRAPLALYDEWSTSIIYDIENFPPTERKENIKGNRDSIPSEYGNIPKYAYIAGTESDISPVKPQILESRIRRAHSLIWSGGKRDPFKAFDEWSKLLFAKVMDERTTPTNQPRVFQVGTNETTASVANRVHELFSRACKRDHSIFPEDTRIFLDDKKLYDIVKTLQDISTTRTDVDSIGVAFENFFGSVFRGELGQYFTMRPLARFVVAFLDITHEDYVIDPTAGSGGFLLEVLLQVWHSIDRSFAGQHQDEINREKIDFALLKVYGIEIHEILARICKINLLLHHDGHTNIEGDRTCLDLTFSLPRLNPPTKKFSKIVGNPPFGDNVIDGDEDHLGTNTLKNFELAENKSKVPSEHVILERSIELLNFGGRLGLIMPDGVLNNSGEQSNCPNVRRFLARNGFVEAIVSLPDYAFRKSGAQNKTSILFFRKFTESERFEFDSVLNTHFENGLSDEDTLEQTLEIFDYKVFLAEANHIGYTTTGVHTTKNDLYRGNELGMVAEEQENTILGEWKRFQSDRDNYIGSVKPDCMSISMSELWKSHSSHRLDPKYFLFKREEKSVTRPGWIRLPIGQVMVRRDSVVHPEDNPDTPVKVMTLSQTGDIRSREAGKGRNPPEWLGMYFEDSSSTWFSAKKGDLVFSSIDLWKGCISVVPEEFDGALVTKEFPIYEITDERLNPDFLAALLRSRYYQRAFRAITTGHSNRRRTQTSDFESLEISFPEDTNVQEKIIESIIEAKNGQKDAQTILKESIRDFSNLIDGNGKNEDWDDVYYSDESLEDDNES